MALTHSDISGYNFIQLTLLLFIRPNRFSPLSFKNELICKFLSNLTQKLAVTSPYFPQ